VAQIGFVSHVSLPGGATPHTATAFAHIPQSSQVWLCLAKWPAAECEVSSVKLEAEPAPPASLASTLRLSPKETIESPFHSWDWSNSFLMTVSASHRRRGPALCNRRSPKPICSININNKQGLRQLRGRFQAHPVLACFDDSWGPAPKPRQFPLPAFARTSLGRQHGEEMSRHPRGRMAATLGDCEFRVLEILGHRGRKSRCLLVVGDAVDDALFAGRDIGCLDVPIMLLAESDKSRGSGGRAPW
jgi:hypothetical protein